ncbi:MAG TPA: TolC family protein [Myxococcota bacterium]|nr:TolC family protein [Myxococcota bacterium]
MSCSRGMTLFLVIAIARAAAAQELKPEDVLGHDLDLSVQQAVQLGLENSLNLQIIRNDPALARERVREAEGVWDPTLNGTFLQNHSETPVASSLQAFFGTVGDRTEDNSKNYGTSLNGILPYGASYTSGYVFQDLSSTSGLTSLKPQYTAAWASAFTLPLLRDLYWGTPDYLVRRSRLDQKISDENFRSLLEDGVLRVETAYWDLSGFRALEVATQQALDTAHELLDQTQVQYQVGTVSKVLVTQAEATLAQRESEHITALNNVRRAQDNLLTVILAPDINDYANTNIRTHDPDFVEYQVDVNAAVEKARVNRPELSTAAMQVEQADMAEKWSWNQKLPLLNLGATYTMNGLSGSQKTKPGVVLFGPTRLNNTLGITGQPQPGLSINPVTSALNPGLDTIPGTADDFYSGTQVPVQNQPDFGFGRTPAAANSSFFDGHGFHSWSVGATFSYPIPNDTADARYVQRKIELRRAKTVYSRTSQDVVLDVRSAVRELQSNIDAVKAAQRQRVASEEALRAEQERLRLGDSTPHNVSLFQDDFLSAQGREITALRNYRVAISALERAQGTLLESRGISVEQERDRGMDQY